MKRSFFILSLILIGGLSSIAQDQSVQVVYITKDYSTEVNPLCKELRDMFDFALKDKSQACVFYLANSTSPMIVKVNLPGDNRKDFDGIIDALMTKSETIINPSTDVKSITSLFDDIGLLDQSGTPYYQNVELIYYITPTFWELGYNEQIIAALYFALDLDADWADGYVNMSIYHNEHDDLTVDEAHPFGVRDLCFKHKFFLLSYGE